MGVATYFRATFERFPKWHINLLRFGTFLIMGSLLSACVSSSKPLLSSADAITDTDLIGDWITIAKDTGKPVKLRVGLTGKTYTYEEVGSRQGSIPLTLHPFSERFLLGQLRIERGYTYVMVFRGDKYVILDYIPCDAASATEAGATSDCSATSKEQLISLARRAERDVLRDPDQIQFVYKIP